jgi:predicted amidohydrolase
MQIALFQCHSQPLDVPGNLERLARRAHEARAAGARLLVTPEMYLTGYNIGAQAVRDLAQPADGAAMRQLAALAREADIALLYGYPERAADGRVYNSVQLLDRDGRALLNYRKTHLFGGLDRTMFSVGDEHFPVVELDGWRLGVLICYDLEFPENTRRLALAGANLIVVPTANMQPFEFVATVTVRSRAFENHCYVAYANYTGREASFEYCGRSSVAGPNGECSVLNDSEEGLLLVGLDAPAIAHAKASNDYLTDRRWDFIRQDDFSG